MVHPELKPHEHRDVDVYIHIHKQAIDIDTNV